MQTPPSQADANSKTEKVPAKVLFFCRAAPVFLPKRAEFEREDWQVADFQILPVSETQDFMAFRSFLTVARDSRWRRRAGNKRCHYAELTRLRVCACQN
jgi:hypothetical protein